MAGKLKPPICLADLKREPEGKPVRMRDMMAMTGFGQHTILRDIYGGYLKAVKRIDANDRSPYLFHREEAIRYLREMGFNC